MKRSGIRWLAPSALLVAAATFPLAGCVSTGRFDEVVAERDTLRARVELLEASKESLDAERVRLIDEMEDLRQEREGLDRDVRKLRRVEAELSDTLASREAELASREQELGRLKGTYEGLVADLEAELAAGAIEIQQLRDGLQLDMSQEVLFPSGSVEVGAGGRAVLAKVAERVRKVPYVVVVQGHTDDVPISTQRFPSNWELAGGRASRVVRILAQGGVDPARLSAVSFGEYRPRAPNDDAKGRARNRRIEITLKPLEGAPPAAVGAGAAPAESTH